MTGGASTCALWCKRTDQAIPTAAPPWNPSPGWIDEVYDGVVRYGLCWRG